jgi:urease accessory protein
MTHDAAGAHEINGIDRAARAAHADVGRWRANLAIRVERRGTASILARARHEGPLVVQRPFYPEGSGVCHLYLLHPPGGIVPGDELAIDVAVGAGSAALVTTPAATKVYRSDGRIASQRQVLSIAKGASLEWLPQETIVFDGARFDADTQIFLEEGAAFVGWDMQCLGRPAIGERFRTGRVRSRFALVREGVPLFLDRFICDGGSDVLSAGYGLRGQPAFGVMVVAGARAEWLELVRSVMGASSSVELFSATLLCGEVLVSRYVGPSASRCRRGFAAIWDALRPRVLGRSPRSPRIWST